jgi:hypothetical protein
MATQELEGLRPEKRDKRFDEQLQVLNTINAIFTGNLWIENEKNEATTSSTWPSIGSWPAPMMI